MKYRIFTLEVVSLLFAACSVKEMDIASPINDNAEEFIATIEEASTKVFVDDKLRVLWNTDDRVSIFNKYTYNQEYRFLGEDGDNSGAFKKVPNDDFVTGNALDLVYSVYPYQESTKITNDGEITVVLPAEQSYRVDSFGLGANTMISATEGNELLFKNLCGYVMLKLYGDNVTVKSISLKGNNNEPLAGKATVSASVDNAPSLTFDASATKEITLTFDTPVTLGTTAETATTFWLVVPPTTFSKGITLTVKDNMNGVFEKSTTKSLGISRNTLSRMSALEVVSQYPGPSDEAIVFADEKVKAKLVAAFDTNGDGELSYKEAVAVTSEEDLKTTLRSGYEYYNFESFDEFCFFTGITIIPNEMFKGWKASSISLPNSITSIKDYAFEQCKNLQIITLPSSIQEIGNYAFTSCTALTELEIPLGIRSLGSGCFMNCTNLQSVKLPESLISISFMLFYGCSSLVSLDIPKNVSSIYGFAFYGCSSLQSISIPEGVSSLQASVFENCTSLASVTLPNSLLSIDGKAFFGCEQLSSVSIPSQVYYIGSSAFEGCRGLSSITIPKNVTKIHSSAFYGCTNLTSIIVQSTTPAKGASYMFDNTNGCPIYVPSSSTEAYKTADYWSDYASRIHAMPSVTIPEAVDLGLPSGVKWASFNLGASKPEEYGDYYAWGEIETKTRQKYNWTNYKFCMGDDTSFTKYCNNSEYGYNGYKDNLSTLELEDDVAHVQLGALWRIPTWQEVMELQQQCEWTWTTQDGTNGYLVTSRTTNNSIFIPACGQGQIAESVVVGGINQEGRYWSSSLSPSYPPSSIVLIFDSEEVKLLSSSSLRAQRRSYGLAIRPITD